MLKLSTQTKSHGLDWAGRSQSYDLELPAVRNGCPSAQRPGWGESPKGSQFNLTESSEVSGACRVEGKRNTYSLKTYVSEWDLWGSHWRTRQSWLQLPSMVNQGGSNLESRSRWSSCVLSGDPNPDRSSSTSLASATRPALGSSSMFCDHPFPSWAQHQCDVRHPAFHLPTLLRLLQSPSTCDKRAPWRWWGRGATGSPRRVATAGNADTFHRPCSEGEIYWGGDGGDREDAWGLHQ